MIIRSLNVTGGVDVAVAAAAVAAAAAPLMTYGHDENGKVGHKIKIVADQCGKTLLNSASYNNIFSA